MYVPVHPGELKDRYLVRPDDPICGHDAQMFLQLSQPTLSSMALQMIRELGHARRGRHRDRRPRRRAVDAQAAGRPRAGGGEARPRAVAGHRPEHAQTNRRAIDRQHVRTARRARDRQGRRYARPKLAAAMACGVVLGQGDRARRAVSAAGNFDLAPGQVAAVSSRAILNAKGGPKPASFGRGRGAVRLGDLRPCPSSS